MEFNILWIFPIYAKLKFQNLQMTTRYILSRFCACQWYYCLLFRIIKHLLTENSGNSNYPLFPSTQALPLALYLAIVGVSENNKLATILLSVNKCIIYADCKLLIFMICMNAICKYHGALGYWSTTTSSRVHLLCKCTVHFYYLYPNCEGTIHIYIYICLFPHFLFMWNRMG